MSIELRGTRRIALALSAGLAVAPCAVLAGGLKVLCSTFPLFQIARNVAHGRDAHLEMDLLLPAHLGCPHDYALTPHDMRKLAAARALIVNGLGLEDFLGPAARKANAGLVIIDTSRGIPDLLVYGAGSRGHAESRPERHDPAAGRGEPAPDEAGKPRRTANPHLFVSPRMAARLALNIAGGLSGLDPAGTEIYRRNARSYAQRLDALADELAALGRTLSNNRVVAQHGVFDYFARDAGLDIVAAVDSHAGQEPPAADMIRVTRAARTRKAGAIFTEPGESAALGRTLAAETGIAAAILDPASTGPDGAPLDYYERVMRRNVETVRSVLGAN
jgi:ABC-type Zn uptake system ZnuABC Zn-binding protein ZnuA